MLTRQMSADISYRCPTLAMLCLTLNMCALISTCEHLAKYFYTFIGYSTFLDYMTQTLYIATVHMLHKGSEVMCEQTAGRLSTPSLRSLSRDYTRHPWLIHSHRVHYTCQWLIHSHLENKFYLPMAYILPSSTL